MSTVDKVIYDALARRRSVVLPGEGSLEVKRRKAKKVAEDRIIPPQNVVSFTKDEIAEGESVTDLLVSANDIGEKEAKETYKAWLKKARTEKGIDIEGVGEVRDGKFVIARGLHTVLNPAEEEAVVLKKDEDRGGPLWIWIVLGLVLAAIALLLFSYFGNGFLGIHKKPKKIEIVTPAVPEPVVADNTKTAEDHIIETLKQSATVPAFHIIAGSFAVESNADDYAKQLQRQFPELSVQKIRSSRNDNWLVSIFNAPTERQAYNKMNMYWDISLDLWVYEQK